ncbi:MAG: organic solvent ABC transporter ATP-binding protein [Gammaproteobacteria bacterium]|nr:organic solvent ABC transporter ATP-binding protein [Gammaproteobacteria bacterium]MCB1925668.1 organic solvent ABC transporter ATP-binding protein [Gammaproteobacteria bacterium]
MNTYQQLSHEHAPQPILDARDVQVPADGWRPAVTLDVQVYPGELHLVSSRDTLRSAALADALLGIAIPAQGSVHFLGADWQHSPSEARLSLRRSIGRVPGRGAWMSTHSVMDNILLPQRHHTLLPEHALRSAATELARRFGLPGLPMQRPDACNDADLRRAACIRAFLGRPTLVVLEHPVSAVDTDLLTPLVGAVQQLRRRRGAVVWITGHDALLNDAAIPADRRHRLVGGDLLAWEKQR